jgi:hypothetical protein
LLSWKMVLMGGFRGRAFPGARRCLWRVRGDGGRDDALAGFPQAKGNLTSGIGLSFRNGDKVKNDPPGDLGM